MNIPLFYSMLVQSVSSIKQYHRLLLLKKSIVFGYFLFWISVFGIIQSVRVGLVTVPQLTSYADQVISDVVTQYPSDLTFTWDGAKLGSKYSDLSISYPEDISPREYALPPKAGFYTSTEVAQSELSEYQENLVVITPEKIYIQEVSGEWSSNELSLLLEPVGPTTVTKSTVLAWKELWKSQLPETQRFIQVAAGSAYFFYYHLKSLFGTVIRAGLLFFIFSLWLQKSRVSFLSTAKLAALFTIPSNLVETLLLLLYGSDTYALSSMLFWVLVLLFIWTRNTTITIVKKKSLTKK